MIIDEPIYDGSLIKQRFAYRFFKKHVSPVGNIVAFRAPMFVSDNLIDLEDSLSKDYIFSDDAVNFCWEIPNLCPFGAVAFQRWFNASIATALAGLTNFSKITLDGDDLMVYENFIGSDKVQREYGKASVSITYSKNNVAIGHTGINIKAGNKAPGFAFSTGLSDEAAQTFMATVCNIFNESVEDISVATSKVIV
jgi:hypothetical protein